MVEQRLVFGEAAELYHRSRPSYPAEMADDVVALVAATARPRAIDIGAGTGKASLLLAERGVDGVAVEPDAAMAAIARRTLASFAGWSVTEAEFEGWTPLSDAVGVDLVICAQAWHWLTPETRVDRAWQLLRRGGWLVLCWNRPAPRSGALHDAIETAYAAHAPGIAAREPGGKGDPPREELRGDARFGPEVARRYEWSHRLDGSGYCELLGTQSDHLLLPAPQRNALFAGIIAAIDAHGGTIDVPTVTDLWAAPRT